MLYFDRINVSEGIDVNKASVSLTWILLSRKMTIIICKCF